MSEPTNTSFIPKRNPSHKDNRPVRRKIYVGTIIIRILFFAAVVAAGGVYAYERQLNSNLDSEILTLNTSISDFKEDDLLKVLAFDARISEVGYRLEHTASLVSLLEVVEGLTVDVVQITQLTVERTDDKNFTIEADLKTPSFDIALFQRQILEETDALQVSLISDLNLQNTPPEDPLFRSGESLADEVSLSFKAALTVDVGKVPHTAGASGSPVSPSINQTNRAGSPEELSTIDERPTLGGEVLEENVNPNEI